MIEHPVMTNELARMRYAEMIETAAQERRANSLMVGKSRSGLLNLINHLAVDLKFWNRTTRQAPTRA
jgi:DNA primase